MHANSPGSIEPRPPRLIVIAAPASGFQAVSRVIRAFPPALDAAVVVLPHRAATKFPIYQRLLHRWTSLPVVDASEGTAIRPGHVYIAPSDRELVIEADRTFGRRDGSRVRGTLGPAHPLLESAAGIYGSGLIAVILTGSGRDGTGDVQSVKAAGGIVIAEHESTAASTSIPRSARETSIVDFVLPLPDIAPALVRLAGNGLEPAGTN